MHSDVEPKARAFIEALHTLERGTEADATALAALFTDDAVLHNAALDQRDSEVRGREGITRFWAEYRRQLGDVRSQFHQVTTNDEAVGLFWTTEGQDPNGTPIHYHGCTLLILDGQGRIARMRGYYDPRQLQLRPTNPT